MGRPFSASLRLPAAAADEEARNKLLMILSPGQHPPQAAGVITAAIKESKDALAAIDTEPSDDTEALTRAAFADAAIVTCEVCGLDTDGSGGCPHCPGETSDPDDSQACLVGDGLPLSSRADPGEDARTARGEDV